MFIKSLQMGFIGLVLCVATAWAATSVLQGIVKDPKGHPIKGADVRIETKDGSKLIKTVKTDANGRYVSDGLPAGVYRVTLVVNGAVKTSINNTKTKANGPTQLNFDLKPAPPSQATAAAKSGKHKVWVPSNTGTHLGGRWVKAEDNGSGTAETLNLEKASAEAARQWQQRGNVKGSGGQ
jgi:Carboxypeptidase regulatory-like domain